MSRYTVIGVRYAQTHEDVEADTPQEAADAASLHASLCWQCSDRLEVQDAEYCIVLDEDGEQVWTDEDATRALRLASDEDLAAEIERRKAGAR